MPKTKTTNVTNEAVDPVTTDPATQPTVPTVADLIPAKARAWIYALLAPINVALAPVLINVEGGAQMVVGSVLAFVNALGFGVAFSNVPRRV